MAKVKKHTKGVENTTQKNVRHIRSFCQNSLSCELCCLAQRKMLQNPGNEMNLCRFRLTYKWISVMVAP